MRASITQRQIEKVMLIFPPITTFRIHDRICCMPMGIAYLGSVLRGRYDVRLLDAVVEGHHVERNINPLIVQYGLLPVMIMNHVRAFNPEVVGVSCLFSNQFPVVTEILNKVKKWNPEAITVIGGTHPTFLTERCLREEALDYVVLGEAEESFPALLQALEKGCGRAEVDGLAFRENGHFVIKPKTKWVKNLDSLPFPARDLLPMEKYFKINIPFNFYSKSRRNVSFITSRGCPFNCNFCSSHKFWGNLYRTRSPQNVLSELEHLRDAYGIKEIKFEDDNLTLDKKRAKAIFRGMIDSRLNFLWNMPNGVMIKTLADRELLRLMKLSGCYEVSLAFESGDQWVLNNIVNKPLDLEQAREIVHGVKKEGIDTHGLFIIGFPGEKIRQIENTFKYAHSLDLDKIIVFFFNPLPGTKLYENCLQRGLIRDEYQTESNNFALSRISDQDWNPELLQKIVKREYWRFTFRLLFRRPIKFFTKYVLWKFKQRKRLKTFYYWFLDIIRGRVQ